MDRIAGSPHTILNSVHPLRRRSVRQCHKLTSGAILGREPEASEPHGGHGPADTMDRGMSLAYKHRVLSERVLRTLRARDDSQGELGRPLMIGIAGMPGSGKSTTADIVCRLVNDADPSLCALVLPMDGFHYSRKELDEFEDPEEAHRRRGAPHTFDGEAFVRTIATLRRNGCENWPAFDHGVGDPVQGAITITRENRRILVEGLYLYLESTPWCLTHGMLDDCWYLRTTVDVAMSRVRRRHMSLGHTELVADHRIATNDRINAEIVSADAKKDIDLRLRNFPPAPRVIDLVIDADEHMNI